MPSGAIQQPPGNYQDAKILQVHLIPSLIAEDGFIPMKLDFIGILPSLSTYIHAQTLSQICSGWLEVRDRIGQKEVPKENPP